LRVSELLLIRLLFPKWLLLMIPTLKKNYLRTFWHFSWPGIRADHLGSN